MPNSGNSRPTIKDVARKADVSYATVSYILNDNKHAARISDETKKRVLKAARLLQYKSNPMGRALQRGYTNQVTLLIITWNLAISHAATAMAISRAAAACDLDVSVQVADTNEDAESFLQKRMLGNSGGLLVLWDSPALKKSCLQQLAAEGLAVVDLLPDAPVGISTVTADREDAGKKAVEHLLKLGHKKIGVISDSVTRVKTSLRKVAGYKAALQEAGIAYDETLVENVKEFGFEGGYNGFRRLIKRHPDMTGLFCINDTIALGAITAGEDMWLRCPRDISVVGFGDAPESTYWRPSLTTFSLSSDAVAAKCIELLVDFRKNPKPKTQAILIPEELIIRGSTGPAKPQKA